MASDVSAVRLGLDAPAAMAIAVGWSVFRIEIDICVACKSRGASLERVGRPEARSALADCSSNIAFQWALCSRECQAATHVCCSVKHLQSMKLDMLMIDVK